MSEKDWIPYQLTKGTKTCVPSSPSISLLLCDRSTHSTNHCAANLRAFEIPVNLQISELTHSEGKNLFHISIPPASTPLLIIVECRVSLQPDSCSASFMLQRPLIWYYCWAIFAFIELSLQIGTCTADSLQKMLQETSGKNGPQNPRLYSPKKLFAAIILS